MLTMVSINSDTGYRAVPQLPAGVDDYGEEFKDLPVCPAFKQIGELRGPFDLGLIPIGAYWPRWYVYPPQPVSVFSHFSVVRFSFSCWSFAGGKDHPRSSASALCILCVMYGLSMYVRAELLHFSMGYSELRLGWESREIARGGRSQHLS